MKGRPVRSPIVRPARSPRAGSGLRLALRAVMVVAYAFLYLPIGVLILFSFNQSRFNVNWQGFTLQWYQRLMTDSAVLNAAKNSLVVAVSATAIATLLGLLLALGLSRGRFPGKRWVEGLLYVPVIVPDTVMGIALLAFYAAFRFELGLLSVVIAHIAFTTPFVALVVQARLAGFDPSLIEAARDLGAGEWAAFRRVTLPLAAPGILAGALLAFTLSLDDFVITFFTAGPGATTLPLYIYSMVKFGVTPQINALSTILLVVTLGVILLIERLQRGGVRRLR